MSPATPARRTQAERTAQTRRALLDATFESLVQVGFKATTTAGVAHRAGVSIGALQSHFRTKTELLTAAVTHSFDRRIEEFGLLMSGLDPSADKLDAAIDLLWSMFSESTFTAWHELWVAARTDPDLARAVIDIDTQFAAACEGVYAELFPSSDGAAALDPRTAVHMIFALMNGLAVGTAIEGYDPYPADDVLAAFKSIIRPRLTAEPHDHRPPQEPT
ncbi:TetR/AcrR family transcriptional regulator [Mycobacterium sp. TNTM28]|uniref:TetR/AcrR family transcriptional regulator n=1 Tax=[Mycobacterium] fortunisiensis TaxID=2600579 RepID=A0ABS6KG24_9MYCO|nr:TetR/AcrR family transcriptional regulator [[Mycobacterium] fortunisiensis]MBU9762491.1 TetR/AcrR family transcriptional regulator [[Mycobacterium] fortunisiensis]